MNTGIEVIDNILHTDFNMDNEFIDSGITYNVDVPIYSSNKSSSVQKSVRKEKPVMFTPGTVEWLDTCLRTASLERAVSELRAWMPNERI